MGRLHCVVLLTPDVARQRAFYETQMGLEIAHDTEAFVGFATRGSAVVLRPLPAGGKPEIALAITASPLDARLAVVTARGAVNEGGVVEDALCRSALVRDPEGNAVQLVEPRATFAAARWPRLSYAIVIAKKFDDTVAFYREVIGLKPADEDDQRVEFDTGDTKLVIYDRDNPDAPQLPADQKIALAFEDAELEAWITELRGRGVGFAASPAETGLGLQVEVEDGEGWFVVLHGPAPEELPDEDELSAEYGGGDDDDRGLPRRGGELGGGGDGRKYIPASKLARKQAARANKAPAPELDRGGFVPRSPRPYTPRPEGSSPRPFTPRPDGPPREGGARPYTPRPDGPSRPYTPRPEGGSSRPFTPRPDGPPRDAGSRPAPRPSGPPRPDRDRSE